LCSLNAHPATRREPPLDSSDSRKNRGSGSNPNPQGLVFTTRAGTPIRRDNLHDKSWKPLLRRAGLPDTRFHDLRHTCATLLLTKGVHPKIVSEMLGHSSIAITLDTYSHVLPGMGDAAASAMEDMLG
jgi:integrase